MLWLYLAFTERVPPVAIIDQFVSGIISLFACYGPVYYCDSWLILLAVAWCLAQGYFTYLAVIISIPVLVRWCVSVGRTHYVTVPLDVTAWPEYSQYSQYPLTDNCDYSIDSKDAGFSLHSCFPFHVCLIHIRITYPDTGFAPTTRGISFWIYRSSMSG